jgi:long-chain acyl-CoA synthetase
MTLDLHLGRLGDQHRERVGDDHRGLFFEGRWYTTGELHDRAARIAGGLVASGVAPGDRVVVVMANTPDVGATFHACWRAGAVTTPAIFLLPPPELRHVLADAGARLVVTGPEFLANVQQAVEGLDVRVVVAGDGAPDGLATLDELATADPAAVVDREPDDLAALLYTGGTTGRSKGVMLTHANLFHAGRSGHDAGQDDDLHRTLVPLPLAHAFGLLVTAVGMHGDERDSSVLLRWFDPAGSVALVEEHGVDQATLVPTMLKLLLALPLEEHDLSSLQRVVVGSAPLPRETLEAFEQRVPSATVCEGYGLTETAAATTTNRLAARRVGSVGTALPGIELRVVDDDGRDVASGEPGEVLVGGPTISPGYWRAPEATATTFVDGWCRTGDIGALDADGYLTILDRKKDLIIRGGFNIYPRDVEDALHEHPDIASAGVVGRPDDTYGEEIVAFVTPQAGAALDPAGVRDWARERLGPKAYPREVHVIDALPLTPVMKLDRKRLRTMV